MKKVIINTCWLRHNFITGVTLYPGATLKGTFVNIIYEALWQNDYIDEIQWELKQKV